MGELLGRLFQEWIGFEAIFGGLFVAFGIWCIGFIGSELRVRRLLSAVLLAGSGVAFTTLGVVLADDHDSMGILKTAVMGVFYFSLFRGLSGTSRLPTGTAE
ncbi:MAG TPA: hypothetical protein VF595_10400 [Tepidisphaeraceae bacterium]|jgi:energy-converting hydrogenase Eha subunit G